MNYLNMNEKKLTPVVVELNTLLAEYNVYYQKLRNFHWNIQGKAFFDLHNQFEEMYSDARLKIDEIAERILTLNFRPLSRMKEYLDISKIEESPNALSDNEMVSMILNDHRMLLKQMKIVINHASNAEDEGTIDLLGAYIRELEKASWMLSAWMKKEYKEVEIRVLQN
ncbi:DNA starvation/stationary phase protection protein [Aureitalea sp. L0-47]|uniref:Dps family protein n=1 Tax=Aureitalea sp. L0-47 TaxID=2816962 RepID=UPI002237321D|nr:DNA starvation/stationary phase protection protein [Aureitalea sp. L0-47]MCW5519281.1 DNA starvation/stationary phase protection protein [Aureitalea sp. L0-47]